MHQSTAPTLNNHHQFTINKEVTIIPHVNIQPIKRTQKMQKNQIYPNNLKKSAP